MADETTQQSKPIWQSKTFLMSLLFAIAPLFPPVQLWIATNPETFSMITGAIFTGLRVVTKDKISIK